jgi:hypothetical protein
MSPSVETSVFPEDDVLPVKEFEFGIERERESSEIRERIMFSCLVAIGTLKETMIDVSVCVQLKPAPSG